MINSGVKKLIEKSAMALSTINPDGSPHSIVVACCRVEEENKIIISNTHIKQTINNLSYDNRVAISVWNKEWEEACAGFEIRGKAENFTTGKWPEYVRALPDNEGYDIKSAIVVTVDEVRQLEC